MFCQWIVINLWIYSKKLRDLKKSHRSVSSELKSDDLLHGFEFVKSGQNLCFVLAILCHYSAFSIHFFLLIIKLKVNNDTKSIWSHSSSFFLCVSPPYSTLSSSLHLSLRAWQPSRSSRRWTRRRAGILPASFLLLPPYLPPCPMSTKRRRLCIFSARGQSGSNAKWQPIITDWSVLPPAAGTGGRLSTRPTECQLQLRKPEHWAANPSGSASGSTAAAVAKQQPRDAELESQGSSGGAQSGIHTTLDTGTSMTV